MSKFYEKHVKAFRNEMFTVQLWKESPGSEVAGKAVKFTHTVYRLVVLYTTRGGGGGGVLRKHSITFQGVKFNKNFFKKCILLFF